MSHIEGYGDFPHEVGDIIVDEDGDLMRIDDLHYAHIRITGLSGDLQGPYTMRTERAHDCRKATAQQMAQARLDMETPICEMEPGEPVYDFFCRLNEKMRDAALAQAQEDRERAEEFVRRYPMPPKRKRGKK